jgi:uncharacterized protein
MLFLYGGICAGVYFFQEKLLFFPQRLPADYRYHFDSPFEEINIKSASGNYLNALYFPADSVQGLVIYFHGNAGSLDSWGTVSADFLRNNYSFLIADYPGYGKSTGKISEENLYKDAQAVYDFGKMKFDEEKIIVYGRSIGTGVAARLASENNPQKLLLEAPYFSMADLSSKLYPFLPSFLLRYPLRTDLYVTKVNCDVVIFHGSEDEVIYTGSSFKLKSHFKSADKLFIIAGGHHNDLKHFQEYQRLLSQTLQ